MFCWPVQAMVETVDAKQVFMADLQAEGANTNRITFPRISITKKVQDFSGHWLNLIFVVFVTLSRGDVKKRCSIFHLVDIYFCQNVQPEHFKTWNQL